jgi:hypothetical protein
VPDLAREHPWPDYTRHAVTAGVYGSMSIGLAFGESVTGALNVYATKPQAFDDAAVEVVQTRWNRLRSKSAAQAVSVQPGVRLAID